MGYDAEQDIRGYQIADPGNDKGLRNEVIFEQLKII